LAVQQIIKPKFHVCGEGLCIEEKQQKASLIDFKEYNQNQAFHNSNSNLN